MGKKTALFALLCCGAIFCFCGAWSQSQWFCALSQAVQVRCREGALTAQGLDSALETSLSHGGDVADATIWNEARDRSAAGAHGRTALLRVLTVYGDAADALPASFLAGGYPAKGDEAGCALDVKAADALFGGRDVTDNILTYEGRDYVVRGVFSGMDGVLVLQADGKSADKYGAAAIRTASDEGANVAQAFLLAAAGVVPDAVIDAPYRARFVRSLSLLPGWLLCLVLTIRIARSSYRAAPRRVRLAAAVAFAAAAAALLAFAAEFSVSIPGRLIPTKWSDFSFWEQKIAQARDASAQIRALAPLLGDQMRSAAALRCGIFSLFSAALFLLALAARPSLTPAGLFVSAAGSFAATAASLLILNAMGAPVSATRALWLAWPACLALCAVVDRASVWRDVGGSAQGMHPLRIP